MTTQTITDEPLLSTMVQRQLAAARHNPDVLLCDEAAAIMAGRTRVTIHRWAKEGKFPPKAIAGRWRAGDVLAFTRGEWTPTQPVDGQPA